MRLVSGLMVGRTLTRAPVRSHAGRRSSSGRTALGVAKEELSTMRCTSASSRSARRRPTTRGPSTRST
eukprot:3548344-Prymnesium_polylepis.1